jgi:cell division FtsZ-interacting protein ZapD
MRFEIMKPLMARSAKVASCHPETTRKKCELVTEREKTYVNAGIRQANSWCDVPEVDDDMLNSLCSQPIRVQRKGRKIGQRINQLVLTDHANKLAKAVVSLPQAATDH